MRAPQPGRHDHRAGRDDGVERRRGAGRAAVQVHLRRVQGALPADQLVGRAQGHPVDRDRGRRRGRADQPVRVLDRVRHPAGNLGDPGGGAAAWGETGQGQRRIRPVRSAVPRFAGAQLSAHCVRSQPRAEPAERHVADVRLACDRRRHDRTWPATRERGVVSAPSGRRIRVATYGEALVCLLS